MPWKTHPPLSAVCNMTLLALTSENVNDIRVSDTRNQVAFVFFGRKQIETAR